MIQKEEGRRKREEGGGKQETRKLGNEAEPLDIYSQAEPENKEADPENKGRSPCTMRTLFEKKRFQSPRKRGYIIDFSGRRALWCRPYLLDRY